MTLVCRSGGCLEGKEENSRGRRVAERRGEERREELSRDHFFCLFFKSVGKWFCS